MEEIVDTLCGIEYRMHQLPLNVYTQPDNLTKYSSETGSGAWGRRSRPERAGYYLRSDVHRGCACSVASKHGIVVRYGLDDR
jgi:hypothetical protein